MRITTYDLELDERHLPCLVKESSHNWNGNVSMPKDIVQMMNEVFRLNRKAEEYLYLLMLNAGNKIIAVFHISKGIINQSFCEPREILVRALISGGNRAIIVHNHPSGNVKPSTSDFESLRKLQKAFSAVGMQIIDSIIIGGFDYFSFNENQMMS